MGSFRELVPRVSPDGRWQDNGPHPSHTTGYSLNYETRGLAVLLILAVGLALGLLYWSARAQDEILIQSSGELAGTGLEIHARTLRNILTDYTYWDDAYENLAENFSSDWFYMAFGDYPYLTDYFGISSTYIIAPGNRVLAYTRDGQRGDDAERLDLGQASGLVGLIDLARRPVDGEFQEASAFVRVDGDLSIAAARVVTPDTEGWLARAGITPQNAMVAVVMGSVDDAFMAALSDDFGLSDIRYAPNAEDDQLAVPLRTIDGETLGFLIWRIDLPSGRIFAVMLPALLAVVAIIGLFAWHLLQIIRNGQRSLFAAMQQARVASRAKDEFLATMSHELRTPMNGVIGIAEILKRSELTDDQKMLLEHLSASANDQLAIVNDLLDLSRIEARCFELNNERFDPVSLVRSAVTLLSSRAEEKGLDLQLDLPDDEAVEVIGDSGRLKQVIVNLLSNAIKFTDEGKVAVTLARKAVRESEEIVLTVRDTGIGIGMEDQARIFDRFTQADSSTARRAKGSGLGLAICKAIVDAMQGSIQLHSAPGEGTTVSVSINLLRADTGAETMTNGV